MSKRAYKRNVPRRCPACNETSVFNRALKTCCQGRGRPTSLTAEVRADGRPMQMPIHPEPHSRKVIVTAAGDAKMRVGKYVILSTLKTVARESRKKLEDLVPASELAELKSK